MSLLASSLVPAGAVAAGVAATAAGLVAGASPASASSGSVLILSTSVSGGTSSVEYQQATALGLTATVATPSTWDSMTPSQFAGYSAIVIGDPSAGGSCASTVPSDALSTAATWGPAVTANVVVVGTAPVLGGATTLVKDAIAYAASGSGTGLYVSLNCEYSSAVAGTAVPLLADVDGGGFTLTGQGSSCPDAGTVNTWQALADAQFNGLQPASLGPWSSPACSVQETFNAWPGGLAGLAYDTAASPATFTASDGATGQAYVLAGAPVSSATAALAQSSGGQVPAGTAAGGGGNAAAPGVDQAASDGVNTENGDYSISGTDLSIPTFGPSLDFTRSYDAEQAQQETQTGTPGAMGYGWTDDWASSLSSVSPVVGDVYSLDGLAAQDGNGGPATGGPLDYPDMSILSSGNVYISDTAGNRIEEIPGSSGTQWGISMTSGDIYTIAGSPTGAYGQSGNGTPDEAGVNGATSSSLLSHPEGLAFDPSGDLYIADTGNNRVMEVPVSSGTQWGSISMTADDLYTVAGNGGGSSGHSGDGGVATSAFLDEPVGLDFGPGSSDLYIADAGNSRIQEVPAESGGQWGQTSMTADYMYTVAGSSTGTPGASANGTLAENANGLGAASLLDGPEGLTFSSAGNMYIADTTNSRIIEIPAVSGAQWGFASMTADDLYTVAGSQSGTAGDSGDTGAATSALLNLPVSVQAYNGQQLYVSDSGNNRIQEVARTSHTEWGITMTANDIYTVAGSASGTAGFSGDGGLATSALLNNPGQVALDGSLDMYIPDTNNNREREVSSSTYDISEVAGDGQTLASMGDGGPAVDGELFRPAGQAEDASGDIYIADMGNNRILEVAATSHTQWGISMTAGCVYTVAGSKYGLGGFSGDGGGARSALLNTPTGIVVDSAGDLFIADQGNNRIREVSASSGDITTIAGNGSGVLSGNSGPATSAGLESPQNIAVDSHGDVFIADNLSDEVREVYASGGQSFGQTMTAGHIYVIAGSPSGTAGDTGDGGPASSALLNQPQGVALDSAGNLYIADSYNNRVQEIPAGNGVQYGQQMTKYDIYTIAGSASGAFGETGDGGPATAALLQRPVGLAIDSAGDLFIADAKNNRVQEVPAANGTQWGTSMTAGDMYTIAGSATGAKGESGDGGTATLALMSYVIDISVDSQGNLYVTDWAGNHVREVAAATTETIQPAPSTLSALYPAPGSTIGTTTYPGGITITQPGGAQVTFYTSTGGSCSSPYVMAGQYCALPEDIGASLTFSASTSDYTFTPQPGTTYTYNSGGTLLSETDAAGNALMLSYGSPVPGSGNCPSAANWCETLTSASGRAETIGYNASGMVTSVTDPMGRRWTYAYNSSSQLTSATDPMGNVTSYSYSAGTTGNPLNANNLTTITDPNEQSGGPDAGTSTSITYNAAGQVTSQTDPMGFTTSYTWAGFNPATGYGIITVADPDGNKAVYDYVQGTLAAQSAWTGTTLTSEQDYVPDQTASSSDNSAGTQLETATADGNGNITAISYNTDGRPTLVTAPSGDGQPGTSTSAYTSSLQVQTCAGSNEASPSNSCTQNAGPAIVAAGTSASPLAITPPSSAPPVGLTYTRYDSNGNALYMTTGVYPPNGSTASYQRTTYRLFNYDSVTLPGSSTATSCTYAAPSPSLPCTTINADGVVSQLEYNSAGDLILSSTPDGNSGGQLATATYGYDTDGEQTSVVSADGNVSGANSGNYTTSTAYNYDGAETSVIQGNGSGHTDTPRTTSYGYDGDGNQLTETDPRGYTTTTTYNADDQAVMTTDPLGDASLTCYDGDGNLAQTVPAIGVAANSLTSSSCPTSYPAGYSDRLASDATVDTFNALGQSTSETDPAPAGQSGYETTTYTYDPDGNVLTTTAPSANGGSSTETVDTYNTAGELASVTPGYGTSAESTLSYCYSPSGQETSSVYGDGNTGVTNVGGTITGLAACSTSYPWTVSSAPQAHYQTTYAYDSAGDQASVTTPVTAADPSGGTTSCTYDANGNTLTSTDPAGVTTTWTYSPLGYQTSESFSGSAAHTVTWSYDASGQRTGMSDATGSSSYAYDTFGEVTSYTNGAGNTTAYAYDADGDITGITYPLPSAATWATTDTISYGYDITDGMTSVTDFNGRKITITSDADGDPLTETLGSSGDTITSTYDPAGNLATETLANGSGALESFGYAFSPADTITGETDVPSSLGSPSYTYDNLGRVASGTPSGGSPSDYGYDASGNLTALPNGATATNYDYAGELTSSTVSGTTTSYAYDADGRQLTGKQGSTTLTSATWNGASQLTAYSSPSATMTATYDGDGLRASEGGSTSQAFTWEVGNDQLLMDSTNAYIYGPGGTVAEQVNLSTGTASYLITDTIDSTRGIVSTSGALLAKTSYDAWGNPATSGGLTSYTPFGFAGGYTDPDGLIYLINRYYNPAEGQFISADPALSETGEPYAYTGGDPLMDKDPDGLKYHHFSKTLSFAITTNTINWDLSLCAGQYVSACAGVGFSVKKTQGKVTFAVGWYSYKNTVSLSNASGTFDTCHWVDTGPHGNFRYCNRGLVQPVFGFYLWTPSVFGQKQKLLWGYNDQLSDNDKPVKQGGTGEIPLGPSKEQPRKSYFTWQLWALNDWSGQAEGGGQWYPVPQANLGHILL